MKKIMIFLLVSISVISLTTYPALADDIDDELGCFIDNKEILDVVGKIEKENKIEIISKIGVVFERNSKKKLWGKNETQKSPMASTTKIMTAIILLENVDNLEEEIEICKQAANVGGSRLGLHKGDKITLNDLLYGLMLRSGNDTAIQIAISVSGSIEKFADLMNNKAKELDLRNTHFVTPHGLDNDEHYTTAYELAKMADYALHIEKFSEIVKTKTYTIKINGYGKTISNTNELLGYLDGVNGVKTGFTNNAGRCLVTSVNRDGFEIITVILGADTKKVRTRDSIKLIEYIYSNYELIDIREMIKNEFDSLIKIKKVKINKGIEEWGKLVLENNEYDFYPVRKDIQHIVNMEIEVPRIVEAPIYKGEVIGNSIIKINNEIIGKINVVIQQDVLKKTINDYLLDIFQNIKQYY